MHNSYDKFAKTSETSFDNWMTHFTKLGTKGHEHFEAILDKDGNASLTTVSPNFLYRIISWIFKPKSRRINTVIKVALGMLNANAEYLHKSVDDLEKMRLFFYSGKRKEKALFINQYQEILSAAKTHHASTNVLMNAKKDAEVTCAKILGNARQQKSDRIVSLSDQARRRIEDVTPQAEKIKKKADEQLEESLENLAKIDLSKVENYIASNISNMELRLRHQADAKQKQLIEAGNTKAKQIHAKSLKVCHSIDVEMIQKMDELHQRYPSLFNACLVIHLDNVDQTQITYFNESYLESSNAADQARPQQLLKKLSLETCSPELREQLENKKIQSVYELKIPRYLNLEHYSDLIAFLQTGKVPNSIYDIGVLFEFARRNGFNSIADACLKEVRENSTIEKLYSFFKSYIGVRQEINNEAFKALENISLDQFQDLEIAKKIFNDGLNCYLFSQYNDQQKALLNQFEINLLYPVIKLVNPDTSLVFNPFRLTQTLDKAVCNLLKALAKNKEKTHFERSTFLNFILFNILDLDKDYSDKTIFFKGKQGERIIDLIKKEKNYLSYDALRLINRAGINID